MSATAKALSDDDALWLFDLGNTRLKFAPLGADSRIGPVRSLAHDGSAWPDGWEDALPARGAGACLVSVAAEPLRVALLQALAARCGRVMIARSVAALRPGTPGGLRLAYAQPQTLGADRFLAMLGARARGDVRRQQPWLVVGIGTAITLDLIDADGRHHGGRIAPSPTLMREALHARAAQLPASGGAFAAFADTTEDALRSGCDGAALGLIAAGLHDAAARLGTMPALLLHGGGVDVLAGLDTLPVPADIAPALVLEGLAAWAGAGTSAGAAAPDTPVAPNAPVAPDAPAGPGMPTTMPG